MKVAINGTGIAGPALAYWLLQGGHEVILTERAPTLRRGGYVVDFWGLGFDVSERMGLVPRLMRQGYQVQEVRFVDDAGHKRGGFGVDTFRRLTGGRFTSLRRSDLASTIYSAIEGRVEMMFDNSIRNIEQNADGARVFFEHGEASDVDLVIGADGLHSRVRALAFGQDDVFEVPLGYHVAAFEVEGYRPRDELTYVSYGLPGRQMSRLSMRGDSTLFFIIIRDELLGETTPVDIDSQKRALRRIFAPGGWECARILDAMDDIGEIYFDRVSQIRMRTWTHQRTALVGDAGACVSLLAGEGAGLAITEAYVLAGELNRSGGDYRAAYARYEQLLKPFVAKKQVTAKKFASSFAPRTRFGIGFRNFITNLLRIRVVADLFVGRDLRDDLALPEYSRLHPTT